jgi:hypothetical protein
MWRLFTGIIPFAVVSIFCIVSIGQCVSAKLDWDNNIGYTWNMADKSSTLTEKSKYIDEFIAKLKDAPHAKNGALVWKTRDNAYDLNLQALETLGKRLREIQTIDINSFAYQTAIQQITAQEQGEAKNMIDKLYGAWVIENYLWAFEVIMIWLWSIWGVLICWLLIAVFWWIESK